MDSKHRGKPHLFKIVLSVIIRKKGDVVPLNSDIVKKSRAYFKIFEVPTWAATVFRLILFSIPS